MFVSTTNGRGAFLGVKIMAQAKAAVQSIEPSFGESIGINVREVIDSEPSVVRGYRAASDSELVAARKAANAARTSALTARLMADLKG